MPPAWTDATRHINGLLEVNWSKDGATWVDESDNLISSSGSMALPLPWRAAIGTGSDQPPWTMRLEMANTDDRYSALNAASPIYADIADNKGHGIPIRFSMGIDDGAGGFTYTRQFTGIIDQITISSTVNNRVTITCLDNTQLLVQFKESTTMYTDETAAQWIAKLAGDAGITALDLDDGIFCIPFLWLSGENIWPEMVKAARAEGGIVYFNAGGTLVYENMEAYSLDTRHTVSQMTLDPEPARDLAAVCNWRDAYNNVNVEYQPRAERGRQIVFESDQAIRLLPGETQTIPCQLRYPCAAIFAPVKGTDYLCQTETGQAAASDISVVQTNYAQRVDFEFTNGSAYKFVYIRRLRIKGKPVQGYQSQRIEVAMADAAIGTDPVKEFPVSGNEYLQTRSQANSVANLLADAVKTARMMYTASNVPGIPGRLPGDLITIAESGSGIDATAFITSITWRYSGGAFVFTSMEAADAADWFGYSDYFLLGTDVLGGTKRVFH